MKTLSAHLSSHYAERSTTIAHCLRIARQDGQVFRFTSHDRDITVSGEVYSAGPGLEMSALQYTAGFAPDNLELRILYADDAITRDDLLAGRWDDAAFRLFEVDYTTPAGGVNVLLTGTTGEAKVGRDSGFSIELRSLKQRLQKPIGLVTQKTCRYRLGDDRCTVNLAPWTAAGLSVSSVTSSRVFTASALAAGSPPVAADYYKEGLVTFTTGDNAGLTRKVKAFAAGQFELVAPFPFAIAPSDLFTAIAGCRKRLEDCRDKFDNVLNFGGEPHLVGVDALTAVPPPGA